MKKSKHLQTDGMETVNYNNHIEPENLSTVNYNSDIVVENRATQDTSQSLKVNFFCHFYIPFFSYF